jgi:hypothetical protein
VSEHDTTPGNTTIAEGLEMEFLTEHSGEQQFCRLYWAVKADGRSFSYTVASLGELIGVAGGEVTTYVAQRCRVFFPDESCTVCHAPRAMTSRADYTATRGTRRWRGPQRSTCRRCQEDQRIDAQRAVEERRRLCIAGLQEQLAAYRREFSWIPPSLLSFEDAVFLLALFRAGGSEDLAYVVPHAAFALPLSPTTKFDRAILDRLYRNWILAIHPASGPDTVSADETGRFESFFPLKVHWLLPVPETGPSPARYLEDLEVLLQSPAEWPDDWAEDARELHRTVAFEECLEYLRLSLEEHGFDSQPGEKLSLVIRSVLRHFSIGQTYNFIWRAARDAAAFYLRERTARTHARNIVPGAIQRMAERALAEGWTVKSYRRDRRAPESQVSHVLFTMALRLPDGGFNTVPPAPLDQPGGLNDSDESKT